MDNWICLGQEKKGKKQTSQQSCGVCSKSRAPTTQTILLHTRTHDRSEERAGADDACADNRNEETSGTAMFSSFITPSVVHAREEERERRADADDHSNNLHDTLVEEVALEEHEADCRQEKKVDGGLEANGPADACQ